MADEKKTFRSILSEARAALGADCVRALSDAIQVRLLQSALWRGASCVVLYSSKDNEVLTDRIFAKALKAGRPVFYSKVDRDRGQLRLLRVADPAELVAGAFGIAEPAGGEAISSDDLTGALICVPGLAFTAKGERLGRGGGFYDRFISQAGPGPTMVGLAYSFQLLDRIPQGAGDQRLHYVITESAMHTAENVDGSAPGGKRKEVHPGGNSDRNHRADNRDSGRAGRGHVQGPRRHHQA